MGATVVCSFLLLACGVLSAIAGPPLQIERERGSSHKLVGQRFSARQERIDIEPRFRLPVGIIPIRYDVAILPILDVAPSGLQSWSTSGELTIRVRVLQANLQEIQLHKNKDLVTVALADISVLRADDDFPVAVTGETYGTEDDDIWTLHLGAALENGTEYKLGFKFTGQIPVGKTGLYRADYKDENGATRWLATTQFETVGFRRVLPGFDEPSFKAMFKFSIGHLSTHTALANSKVADPPVQNPAYPALPNADYVWTNFEDTVQMSSYLIAFVVSGFTFSEADTAILGKPVRIYGPEHLITKGGGVYSANVSAHLLKTFENTFVEPYAMHKMDSVAIPREWFEFGAMENYGLNTYRDNALLYYPGESTEDERHRITSVLSHELAHQWFGNLVTCSWWSDIWLNEGFASYVSFLGLENVAPEYDAQNEILYDTVQNAQLYDAGPNSHPVINTAEKDEVVNMSIFDGISYDKGASLIRMMEGWFTRDVLLQGLREYLQDRKFKNAEQSDLFRVLDITAHGAGKLPASVNLKDIMETYTLQKGLPLVRVARADSGRIYISQERFKNNANQQQKELDPDELWEVGVALTTQSSMDFSNRSADLWIPKNVALMSHSVNTSEWIIANPDGFGYYRTLYDTPLTQLIQAQLNSNHRLISPLSKSQLIDDYFKLADEGYIQLETALGMTRFLGSSPLDTDHAFWYPALNAFKKYLPLFTDTADFASLRNYLGPKIEAALNQTGWSQAPNEHGTKVMLRAVLLDWACALENPLCQAQAKQLFADWKVNNVTVPIDLQPVVYCTAIAEGTRDDSKAVLEAFHKETETGHKSRLFNALACDKSIENLLQLALYSVDPEFQGYTNIILANMAKSSYARGNGLAFGFMRDNWEKLVDHTAQDPEKVVSSVISSTVSTITGFQTTAKDVENLNALIKDISTKRPEHYKNIEASLNASLAKLEGNVRWMEEQFQRIKNWFIANSA